MRKFIFVSLAVATFALNAASAVAKNPTIIVRGVGDVAVTPDVAFLTIDIRSRDKNPEQAQLQNTLSVRKLTAALLAAGMRPEEVSSTAFNFKRDADLSNGQIHELGFYADSSIQIKTHSFALLPKIIGTAISNGATSVGDINYDISEKAAYIDKARIDAFSRAKDDAEKSALAAGLKLGAPQTITLGDASIGAIEVRSSDGEADVPAARNLQPLIVPGYVHVSYIVNIEYEVQ